MFDLSLGEMLGARVSGVRRLKLGLGNLRRGHLSISRSVSALTGQLKAQEVVSGVASSIQ